MSYFSERRRFRPQSVVERDPPPRTPAAAPQTGGVADIPPDQWPPADSPTWSLVGCDRTATEGLYNELSGFLSFPGLPDYEAARAAQNEADWPTPRIIAYCHTEHDVGVSLAFARAHDWLLSVRSGGHNRGGYHLCNGLVIDVSAMTEVTINAAEKAVAVQPGTNFEHLDHLLTDHDFVVPGGTCANVCVAGYYLGGGYSLASRTFGMGCDSVRSIRVMLASGKIVEVSQGDDLYWAMLGGSGGQFGVVLGYTLQGHSPDSFWGFLASWPLEQAAEVLDELRNNHMASQTTEQPFGYYAALTVLSDGKGGYTDPMCSILGMYHGTEQEGRKKLASLLGTGSPTMRYSKQAKYSTINTELFELLPYQLVKDAVEEGFTGLVAPGRPLDWSVLIEAIRTEPHAGNLIMLEPYGGAVAANDDGRNSYPHRDQEFDLMIDSFWDGDGGGVNRADAVAWMQDTVDKVRPALSGRVYVNYADRTLRDYRAQYWAQNYPRLLHVKSAVDPDGVFRFDQSIRWAATSPLTDLNTDTAADAPTTGND